jgi:hypothetical protein
MPSNLCRVIFFDIFLRLGLKTRQCLVRFVWFCHQVSKRETKLASSNGPNWLVGLPDDESRTSFRNDMWFVSACIMRNVLCPAILGGQKQRGMLWFRHRHGNVTWRERGMLFTERRLHFPPLDLIIRTVIPARERTDVTVTTKQSVFSAFNNTEI